MHVVRGLKICFPITAILVMALLSGCGSTSSQAPPTQTPQLTISNVGAPSITANSATVAWNTNVNSTSQVDYGTTTAYGSSTTLDSNPVTNHSVPISGLQSATQYNFRVRSKDSGGNEVPSANF